MPRQITVLMVAPAMLFSTIKTVKMGVGREGRQCALEFNLRIAEHREKFLSSGGWGWTNHIANPS